MGEAKRRGTYDERKEMTIAARKKREDEARAKMDAERSEKRAASPLLAALIGLGLIGAEQHRTAHPRG